MNCTNCCEAFIGPCEGYHFIKNTDKIVLCRCCKNEYLALGGMGWTLIGQKTEEEEEVQCYGKHCDETVGLKRAVGWNRCFTSGTGSNRFEENWYCAECEEVDCSFECEACSETYSMAELRYRTGGLFGERVGKNVYCVHCCEDIESRMTLADKWDKDLSFEQRIALLAKTFDNKADSDNEEDEEEDA
jgi:hypothetical protein